MSTRSRVIFIAGLVVFLVCYLLVERPWDDANMRLPPAQFTSHAPTTVHPT